MHSAAMTFVVEKTFTIVSFSHGFVLVGSENPPHKSTTNSPFNKTAKDAPNSNPMAKFFSKADFAEINRSSQYPLRIRKKMLIIRTHFDLRFKKYT